MCIYVVGTNKQLFHSFLFHLINTGAERSQDQRTQKEEKRGRTSPPGTSSKENQGGKTAVGKDQLDSSLTRPRDDTESGILVDYLP